MQTDPDPLWDTDPDDDDDDREGLQPSRAPVTPTPADVGRPRRRGLVHHLWEPRPIGRPSVDPELPRMPWPERCAEAIRYALHAAEHWLSRQGVLREWLRLNLWVGIALLAAALLVVPPVTLLLRGTASWTALIDATVSNIVTTVMRLPPIVIAVGSLLIGARLLSRSWQRRKRRPRGYPDHRDPYE